MTLAQSLQQLLNGNKIISVVTLSKQKYKGAFSVPLLEFEYFTPLVNLDKYDALVITSKEAVKALDYLDWKHKKVYCVGVATAKLVQNVAYFQKSGGANELADYLEKNVLNENLLYCRGEKVSVDLASRLNIDEMVFYKSFCVEKINFEIPEKSTIIFSSPSIVECFLRHFEFKNSFKAIALGKTTSLSLFKANIKHEISPSTKIIDTIKWSKNSAKSLYKL